MWPIDEGAEVELSAAFMRGGVCGLVISSVGKEGI